MLKIGDKVLHKITEVEYEISEIRWAKTRRMYYFKRVNEATYMVISEDSLEKEFNFLIQVHPKVLDKERRKTRKKRDKIDQGCIYETNDAAG